MENMRNLLDICLSKTKLEIKSFEEPVTSDHKLQNQNPVDLSDINQKYLNIIIINENTF